MVVFIVLAALDNVALALVPPLVTPISRELEVGEAHIAAAFSISLLVTAVSAVGWAYLGDRYDRKRLLMAGTLGWAAGVGATALVTGYGQFLAAQVVAAVGLGTVASVGFSVVSDLISPRRRGLVMGLWGLSQGLGTLVGVGMGGILGSQDWRRPFQVLTVVGLAATVAYLFTYRIPRGHSDPELRALHRSGREYEHRISPEDLPKIFRRRTNVWLAAQGFTSQLAFGALTWLPRLFQAKAETQGYAESTAIVLGTVFAMLAMSGALLALGGGLVGDWLQRRTPRGRGLVASIGVLLAAPLCVLLFFLPLELDVPLDEQSRTAVLRGLLRSLVTEPTLTVTFGIALVAVALMNAQSPNWYALLAEVNPPEHRGTAFSVGNLVNGAGRTTGTYLVAHTFAVVERVLPAPTNYAVALAAFQLFFIPTGIMYWLASRSSPRDIAAVRLLMRRRASASATASEQPPPTAPERAGAPR